MPTTSYGEEPEPACRPEPNEQWPAYRAASRGLLVLLLAAFSVDLCVSLIGLAVQFLGIKLDAPTVLLGLYGTVGAGVYALMCLPAGRASDRFSRRVAALFISVAAAVWIAIGLQRSPYAILALVPLSSGSIAFFWPAVQAWLGDLVRDRLQLNRVLGNFNVLWTAGLMVGPVICGYLWQAHHFAPFLAGAGVAWAVAILLLAVPLTRTGAPARQAAEATEQGPLDRYDPRAEAYLPLAWLANFASWYASGASRTLFPKLANELGFSEVTTGWVIFGMLAGQLVTFLWLRQATWWHFRRLPLMLGLLAGGAGMVGTALVKSPAGFALCLAAAGAAVGLTYVASLFYSLQAPQQQRGGRTGIHETIVGAGLASGPLIGGIAGSFWGLRAPFIAAAIVFGIVLVMQTLLWARRSTLTGAQG